MSAPGDAMGEVLSEVIRFAVAGEKINAAARALKLPLEILAAIGDRDPELAPELVAAASQLEEVMETLSRAHTFIDARLDARLTAIRNNL